MRLQLRQSLYISEHCHVGGMLLGCCGNHWYIFCLYWLTWIALLSLSWEQWCHWTERKTTLPCWRYT